MLNLTKPLNSPATAHQKRQYNLGWLSLVVSLLLLSALVWQVINQLQPLPVQSVATPTPSATPQLPTLTQNTNHVRQGAPLQVDPTTAARSDPFLP